MVASHFWWGTGLGNFRGLRGPPPVRVFSFPPPPEQIQIRAARRQGTYEQRRPAHYAAPQCVTYSLNLLPLPLRPPDLGAHTSRFACPSSPLAPQARKASPTCVERALAGCPTPLSTVLVPPVCLSALDPRSCPLALSPPRPAHAHRAVLQLQLGRVLLGKVRALVWQGFGASLLVCSPPLLAPCPTRTHARLLAPRATGPRSTLRRRTRS